MIDSDAIAMRVIPIPMDIGIGNTLLIEHFNPMQIIDSK